MPAPPAPSHSLAASALPPWRALVLLALLVVAVHLLVLRAAPARMAALSEPEGNKTGKSFATRSIEPAAAPPPVMAPPPVANTPPARPAPRPEKKPAPAAPASPEIQPNTVDVQSARSQNATDSIAEAENSVTEKPPAETPMNTTTVADITPTAMPATASAATPTIAASSTTATTATTATTTLVAGGAPQATVVTAIHLPGSAKLQYKMTGSAKGLNYHADAELSWNNSGSQYEAGMKVSALFLGSRSMSSRGQITASGLAPARFSDRSRSELAAHFDAENGKIVFSANTPDAPWQEGVQDRVSIFLQLGGMLAAMPPPGLADGSSITIYTVGPREADNWVFVAEGQELLSLPGGEMATLKLTRKPRREYDQKVEIWYAPALGYLPVRNRITQANGDFVDQQLKSVTKP